MKVMITGASGFLGSYIVDNCIKNGDTVRVLVRKTSNTEYLDNYPDIEYVYGSLEDIESLNKAVKDVDVVYHSAARATDWGSYKQFYDANYIGTLNVLNACLRNKVKKLIYVSSPSVVLIIRMNLILMSHIHIRKNLQIIILKQRQWQNRKLLKPMARVAL